MTKSPRKSHGDGKVKVAKVHVKNRGGRRANTLIAGGRGVVHVPQAMISPTAIRTVISPAVARQIARPIGPVGRTHAGSMGQYRGPTAKVAVAMNGYRAVDVTAVVGELPPGVDALIASDVLNRAVRVHRQDSPTR